MFLFNKYDEKDNSVVKTDIKKEIADCCFEYAISVSERMFPHYYDGLKAVIRRILYVLYSIYKNLGKQFKKSARISGEVMGRFHPHGDLSIYNALVKLTQKFNFAYPLVEGQGNFGSLDGDSAAAARYTEVRISSYTYDLLKYTNNDIFEFKNNYDGTDREPIILPFIIPNLLVSGSQGIGVGYMSYIPQHNLREVINSYLYFLDNQDCSVDDLMEYIKGPDYISGCLVENTNLRNFYNLGSATVVLRSKFLEDEKNNTIIISNLPPQIKKKQLLNDLFYGSNPDKKDKIERIQSIKSIRDLSDNMNIKIEIGLQKGALLDTCVSQIKRYCRTAVSLPCKLICLNDQGYSELFNLNNLYKRFLDKQKVFIYREINGKIKKTNFEIDQIKGIIEMHNYGVDNIMQEILKLHAREDIRQYLKKLRNKENNSLLNESQIEHLINAKIYTITKGEYTEIFKIYSKLVEEREKYLEILNSDKKIIEIIKERINLFKSKHKGFDRFSDIVELEKKNKVIIYQKESIIVVLHNKCTYYIPINLNHTQKNKGKGRILFKEKIEFISEIGSKSKSFFIIQNNGKIKYHKENQQLDLNYYKPIKIYAEGTEPKSGYLILICYSGRTLIKEVGNTFNKREKNIIKLGELENLKYVLWTNEIKNKCLFINKLEGKSKIIDLKEIPIRRMRGVKIFSNQDVVTNAFILTSKKDVLILDNLGYFRSLSIKYFKVNKRSAIGRYVFSNNHLKNKPKIIHTSSLDDVENKIIFAVTNKGRILNVLIKGNFRKVNNIRVKGNKLFSSLEEGEEIIYAFTGHKTKI